MANKPSLRVIVDPPTDGATNMARDEYLLHHDEAGPAVLRLYAWTPATISLGYFQKHTALDSLAEELRELPVVRRQTGGGAILHDREITYSLVLSDSVPAGKLSPVALYTLVHETLAKLLVHAGHEVALAPDDYPLPTPRTGPFFCFEKPGRTDIIQGEKKVLGSAQRRLPHRVLQHGSLLLEQRFADHPGANLGVRDQELHQEWIDASITELAAALEMTSEITTWTADEADEIARRRTKYLSDEWTRRH